MRERIRKILEDYKSIRLERQDEGYVLFLGEEPATRQAVTIKVLPRLLGEDPQIAQRFQGLSQTIRQLNHPNIASIRQVGEESGLPYIITRAIEKAQPLAAKLNQPWAVDAAADLVMQTGQALEHAYNKGVVHGSLTPENIVVQDNGKVVVTDFGLDELMNLVGSKVQEAGSPFLAPERVAGQTADAPADVYSLAAVLYSLLANRPPQVVKGEVLPPSRFNTDVPEAMDQVVVKALASEPASRYPDVKTFLAALGAVTLVPGKEEGLPVTPGGRCPRCGTENQSGRFCRKCGTRLRQPTRPIPSPPPPARSKLDEPIQITRVDVGHLEVGKGVEMGEVEITQPLQIATGELSAQFPEPAEIPRLDLQALWPSLGDKPLIAMPEPPSMPVIDWAEIAPPMPEVPTMEDFPVSEESD
jgi:serine/threonine protein kinase